MPRVVHFEITALEPERAIAFYRDVFGWEIEKWEGPLDYWLADTGQSGPGINGAIMKRPVPEARVVDAIDVTSIDEAIGRIEAKGGQALTRKTTIPRVGYHAYFKDTEGNIFALIEKDEEA